MYLILTRIKVVISIYSFLKFKIIMPLTIEKESDLYVKNAQCIALHPTSD